MGLCGFNVTIRSETGWFRRWSRPCRSWSSWDCWPSGRASAWKAALAGLATACGVAWLVFGMPARMIAASMAVGVVFALLRIVWLIVAAVFLYDITVATGQFEIMKASVARLSADRRLAGGAGRVLLRGIHRGGRRVRRPGRDLRGFPGRTGVSALRGGLALPDRQHGTRGLGRHRHSHPDAEQGHRAGCACLERHLGRILPILSLVIPFWLVRTMTGWRETAAVWFPLSVIGGTFASVQFLWSNYVGFELVDIVASVASMVAGVIVIRLWRPRQTWRFERDLEADRASVPSERRLLDTDEPGPSDRRADHAGLDAVCALDRDRAGLGYPGDQAVGNSRGQGLARPTAFLETRALLAPSQDRQGRGGDRAREPRAAGSREGPGRDRPAVVHGHGRLSGGRGQRLLARFADHRGWRTCWPGPSSG